jgi:hypothetical protein
MGNKEGNASTQSSVNGPKRRDSGHYLLLLTAVVFLAEEYLFLVSALSHAGRQPGTGARFLVLGIGVFLTAVIAFYGFARRIEFTVGVFFGLLLVQPAISAMANLVGGAPQKNPTIAFIAGVAGVLLLVVAVQRNRRPSISEHPADSASQ